jgi:hypothetical protein
MTGQLIGLGGKLRAGKDAVGDYLVENKNFVKLGMSDALNEALLKLDPIIRVDLDDDGVAALRYQQLHAQVGYVEAKKNPEVRRLLQVLGTEVGREMIDQQVWVNIAKRKIQEHWDAGRNVVITAIRFPNEIDMVLNLGGYTVWVERPAESRSEGLAGYEGVPGHSMTLKAHTEAPGASQSTLQTHASETSVSEEDFEFTLVNDSDLENLYSLTERLTGRLGITN